MKTAIIIITTTSLMQQKKVESHSREKWWTRKGWLQELHYTENITLQCDKAAKIDISWCGAVYSAVPNKIVVHIMVLVAEYAH